MTKPVAKNEKYTSFWKCSNIKSVPNLIVCDSLTKQNSPQQNEVSSQNY